MLVQSAWPGDQSDSDFAAFYEATLGRFQRLAFVLTRDPELAEDLAQEALSRVEPRFAQLAAPLAYTRQVLVNLVRTHRGREARRRKAEAAVASIGDISPEARELLDVVNGLPFRQRAVIVLRYFEDLSEAEIADALNCRRGTVKSLASRALARLRTELGP